LSPILGIWASQNYPRITSSYESIATTVLGSATSTIDFTSIPQTYKHLQIRFMARDSRTGTPLEGYLIRFNSDTAATYQDHMVFGDGSSAATSSNLGAGATAMAPYAIASAGATASVFGVSIVDVLDYTNTNKYKTIRGLSGTDNNGAGAVGFTSGAWRNTAAVTAISIVANVGSFQTYTHAALYGIKG
jgi:hypothetical protein